MIDTYVNNLCKELDVKIKIKHLLLRDVYWLVLAAKLSSLVYLHQKVVNNPVEMDKITIFCKSLVEEIIGRKLIGEVYPDEEYYSTLKGNGSIDDIYAILVGIKVRAGYQGRTEEFMRRLGEFVREAQR
nr:MAG TPA: hypothetical protein [Caudoviricetes sp.]